MRFRCSTSENQLSSIAGLSASQMIARDGVLPLRLALGFSKPPIFFDGEDEATMHGGFRSAFLLVSAQGASIDPATIFDETIFEDTMTEEETQKNSSSSKATADGGLKKGILAVFTLGLSLALAKEQSTSDQIHMAKPRSYPVKRIKATVPGVWECHGIDNEDGILSGQYLGKSDLCSITDLSEDEETTVLVSLSVFAGDFELTGNEEGAKGAIEKILVAKEILGKLYEPSGPSTISKLVLEHQNREEIKLNVEPLKAHDDAR